MNHLEKEVAPLSTFESKLIKENQNLLKKLDQQTQRITQQDQQITEQTLKIQQLTEQVEFLNEDPQARKLKLIPINSHFLRILI